MRTYLDEGEMHFTSEESHRLGQKEQQYTAVIRESL